MKAQCRQCIRALVIVAGAVCGVSALGQPQAPSPPPPQVRVMTVAPADVPIVYKYVGITAASKIVEIRARVRGFLESRAFAEGSKVEEGAPLFKIDPRPFEADLAVANARIKQAQAMLRLADQDVKRLQSVSVPGAVAETDVDQAVAAQAEATAAVQLAEAERDKAGLELSYSDVASPMTGYIGKALREIGSYVDDAQNSLLAVMQQVDPIYVSFRVSEREFLSQRQQQSEGELVLSGVDAPYVELTLANDTVYPHRGAIDFSSTSVDLQTGTIELRATFPNPDDLLKPGQFVEVEVKGWAHTNALSVPQRAVGQSPSGSFVYTVGDDNVAEIRPIEVGPWVGADWIIESGLDPGDRVIVEGVVKVQPGVTVAPATESEQNR